MGFKRYGVDLKAGRSKLTEKTFNTKAQNEAENQIKRANSIDGIRKQYSLTEQKKIPCSFPPHGIVFLEMIQKKHCRKSELRQFVKSYDLLAAVNFGQILGVVSDYIVGMPDHEPRPERAVVLELFN